MKITRVEAGSPPHRPEAAFHPHASGVSLIAGSVPLSDDYGFAPMIGEVLFGVPPYPPAGAGPLQSDGQVEVQGAEGSYTLRRHNSPAGPRLTIAASSGRPADSGTVERLTSGLPPTLLGRVFFWRRHDRGLLAGLLSDDVATAFQQAIPSVGSPANSTTTQTSYATDQVRLEQRDALAAEIEALLAERRERNDHLEQSAADIESRIAALSGQRSEVERRLRSAETELEEIETRLRYHAIAETAEREVGAKPPTDWEPQLDEIEEEIARWRATLADLEHREATLRSELTQVHPDDGSAVLPLADQRAAIAVATRLTRDIESEVARLARAAGSNACVCQDAHPRLNPLVDTLGQQLRRLTDLADQQERALRVQELQAEAEHVARSQQDLRQQLDHLLKRRQELWRSGRPRRNAGAFDPSLSEGMDVETATSRLTTLREQAVALRVELNAADAELASLRQQRETIARERSGLLADSRLNSLQQQLEVAQRSLSEPQVTAFHEAAALEGHGRWRASELFAKLTDGRYRSLQLVGGGRDVVAVDAYGYERPSAALGDQDRDLAAISLMIAMAAELSQCGVVLPMVFDDPFALLDARHAAILANLLDDYARGGRQVLVVTSRAEAIDRFAALGVSPLNTATPIVAEAVTSTTEWKRPSFIADPPAVTQTTVVKTAREYLLDGDDPIESFPAVMNNRGGVFANGRVRTIIDLMSADPSALAEELDRDDITAELVAIWQTHLSLVCFIPGVSFDDAVAFTAVGVYSPEDLADIDSEELLASLQRYLASDAGGRLRAKGYSVDGDRTRDLIARAGRGVRHWRSSDHWNRWSRHRGERRQRISANASRRSSSSRGASSSRLRVRSEEGDRQRKSRQYKKQKKEAPKRRWYLEVGSPIVDAPSIGPKTAIKLERAGVATVDNLLEADAADLAERLDARNIDAERIVAWQHQAQLVCRIPQLRGHDAQIMVASGFTAPEEIASMKPSELLEFVEPFCSSSDGQRVLRNAAPPDLEEVTNWIAWARESRALGAA